MKVRTISRQQWKMIILSSLGGGLEFYDFVIFAVFAPQIGAAFFPAGSELIQLISAFALFAIGYLARPFGGIVLSHFGDRFGRKKTFLFSIMLMAFTTLLMAITPSNQTAGLAGTLMFVTLRVFQGVAIGGEIPGAITFVSEHVPESPGLACSYVFLLLNLGIFLADGVQSLLNSWLTPVEMQSIGWRIAFFIGGLLAVLSFILRRKLAETPAFMRIEAAVEKFPFLTLLKTQPKALCGGILISGLGAATVSLLFLYPPAYLHTIVGYSSSLATIVTMSGLLAFSFAPLVVGPFTDHIFNRRLFLLLSIILFILISIFIFQVLVHKPPFIILWYFIVGIFAGFVTGTYPATLTTLFPVSRCYTGVATSYNIGFAIFGGLSPLLASIAIKTTNLLYAPGFVLAGAALCALLGWLLISNIPDPQKSAHRKGS